MQSIAPDLLPPAAKAVTPAFSVEVTELAAHNGVMPEMTPRYSLNVVGSFSLRRFDGVRINISSKKGRALIALLAMARDGERSRAWLQDKLWGSRQLDQAQSSLRQELTNLRKLLSQPG